MYKTKEEIAEAVLRVAPRIYNRYWNLFERAYQQDDFTQDAYLHIQRLFNEGYIKPDRDNIDGIVYSLLNSFFVRNIIKSQKQLKETMVWDLTEESDYSYTNSGLIKYGDIEDTNLLKPDAETAIHIGSTIGKQIVESILDNLDFSTYKTYKHIYKGLDNELGKLNFSEKSIAKLIFNGYNLQKTLEVFGFEGKDRGSQTAFISKKYKEVSNLLENIFKALPKEDLENVLKYIQNIDLQKASYQY